MGRKCHIAFETPCRRITAILLLGIILVAFSACPRVYTDETMQPLAATASDLGDAVMGFAKDHPKEAALLDDQELVRRATAFDPKLLEPYKGLKVRGTIDGVILVCTGDGRRGLIEDAECSDKVDKLLWLDSDAPCEFTLTPEAVCRQGEPVPETGASFANSRIPTFIDARHAIAHNKIMIIDQSTVIAGPFNFTKAAEERNAENLLIIQSKELARIYIENWKKHLKHSERYEAR